MERSPPENCTILKAPIFLTEKLITMKTTLLKLSAFILLFTLMGTGCEKEEDNLVKLDGYIVGFDPCTVNHHYQIGYVIISTDLKDTLVTYNLSDEIFKMSASVLLQPSDTLYKIPESYFKAGRGFYFPESARNEFKVKITYRYPKENEKSTHLCTNDLSPDFPQVIITLASKSIY